MADNPVVPAAEFQALPLDFVIASPLISAVKAQAVAAAATRDFINAFKNPKDDTPESVSFVFSYLDGADKKTAPSAYRLTHGAFSIRGDANYTRDCEYRQGCRFVSWNDRHIV
jgi:hypothetical protein